MRLIQIVRFRFLQWVHNCIAHPLEGCVVLFWGHVPGWVDRFHDWTADLAWRELVHDSDDEIACTGCFDPETSAVVEAMQCTDPDFESYISEHLNGLAYSDVTTLTREQLAGIWAAGRMSACKVSVS